MATQPTTTSVAALPGIIAPMPAVARILSRYDRPKLAAFIAVAIDLLDLLGPDTEENPDFSPCRDGLPGDPADTEPYCGDEHDIAWPEWHQRGRHKLTRGKSEMAGCSEYCGGSNEDEEQDDPAGQYDEDYYTGRALRVHGPGCTISDSDCCLAGDDRGMGIE